MKRIVYSALMFLLLMTLLTGIIYPLLITGIARVLYPWKSQGSLVIRNGNVIGSELIGQKFESQGYFWSRPSATDYNPMPSSGSNFGPLNGKLILQVHERDSLFRVVNKLPFETQVPAGMITSSGSGLDPHISPEEALMQVERIASVRGLSREQKDRLLKTIGELTEQRQFYILGEPRINVFLLNLRLDTIK